MKKLFVVVIMFFMLSGCRKDNERFFNRSKDDLPEVILKLNEEKGKDLEIINIKWINLYTEEKGEVKYNNYYFIHYFNENDKYIVITIYHMPTKTDIEVNNEFDTLDQMIQAYESRIDDCITAVKFGEAINMLSSEEDVLIEYYADSFSGADVTNVIGKSKAN